MTKPWGYCRRWSSLGSAAIPPAAAGTAAFPVNRPNAAKAVHNMAETNLIITDTLIIHKLSLPTLFTNVTNENPCQLVSLYIPRPKGFSFSFVSLMAMRVCEQYKRPHTLVHTPPAAFEATTASMKRNPRTPSLTPGKSSIAAVGVSPASTARMVSQKLR